ncbi:MAG: bacillithiol biosynthesis deacetylase BshB1 [Candidatus Glassbacteria bacterium]|nr:bacillithiol biosynthesis deacetylase BshB1 [Candidatus Glassbacteria bacterium]
MSQERLDVLAVSAHPDDAELTCGGTLIRCADAGYRVGALELTGGESGSRGSAGRRSVEAAAAAEIMGLALRESLGLPDAALEDSSENRVKLARAIRRLGPRVLILPNNESWRHPDHGVTVSMGRAAAFLAGLKKIPGEGSVERPEKIIYCQAYSEHTAKPSFVVDISEQFERKMKAVMCYSSQFEGRTEAGELFPNGQSFPELIRTHCAYYGSLIRRPYGEPFYVSETLAVDDVVAMGVKSI